MKDHSRFAAFVSALLAAASLFSARHRAVTFAADARLPLL